jgi:hypothetical protein
MAKVSANHDIEMKALQLKQQQQAEEQKLEDEKARREIARKDFVAKEELRIKEQVAAAEHHLDARDQRLQHILDTTESIHKRLMDFEVASAKKEAIEMQSEAKT